MLHQLVGNPCSHLQESEDFPLPARGELEGHYQNLATKMCGPNLRLLETSHDNWWKTEPGVQALAHGDSVSSPRKQPTPCSMRQHHPTELSGVSTMS